MPNKIVPIVLSLSVCYSKVYGSNSYVNLECSFLIIAAPILKSECILSVKPDAALWGSSVTKYP